MKYATAGTLESNDCLVTIYHHDVIEITIESIVFDAFGVHIETVIREVLRKMRIKGLKVHIKDKGALDYTIEARLMTALKRLEAKL